MTVSPWPSSAGKRTCGLRDRPISSSLPLFAEPRVTGQPPTGQSHRNRNPLHTATADRRHPFVTTMLDAGVDLRDVQIAARHADPRTTTRYDRARQNLDRHPNYILAAYMASGT
jgi:hypothetical protein